MIESQLCRAKNYSLPFREQMIFILPSSLCLVNNISFTHPSQDYNSFFDSPP